MQTMRAKTSIGFKANAEADQDIIAWWEALPTGDRSRALRDLIRAAITNSGANHNGNGHAPEMVQVAADTAWLRSALMELPNYLEGLFSRMPVAHTEGQAVCAQGQPEEQPRMDQVALDRRRANMKRSSW
jgi:hypothetical protein